MSFRRTATRLAVSCCGSCCGSSSGGGMFSFSSRRGGTRRAAVFGTRSRRFGGRSRSSRRCWDGCRAGLSSRWDGGKGAAGGFFFTAFLTLPCRVGRRSGCSCRLTCGFRPTGTGAAFFFPFGTKSLPDKGCCSAPCGLTNFCARRLYGLSGCGLFRTSGRRTNGTTGGGTRGSTSATSSGR